jgi:hypothetical protein
MNVHEWHGNLPMNPENADVKRLSIVCYLRRNLWEKTKHKTKKFMISHNKRVKELRGLGAGLKDASLSLEDEDEDQDGRIHGE